MEDYRDAQTCKARVGLLFLSDCGSMVKHTCVTCGRPVCRIHSIETNLGVECPECGAKKPPEVEAASLEEDASLRSARSRNRFYGGYGYSPFYYGHSRYYSDSDYRTFDDQEVVYEEPPESNNDIDETDDYMES